ncbi:MAG: LysR family transcriptional regulator [Oscillospiraceae bacterium]|nr:LysR family transcriptional regulator [Oscillospiraceae bacterium]
MNTTQVRCFLAVAQAGSVSHAAEALYIAQPSISRYLAQLEEEWGVRLFDRKGKRMVLTPPRGRTITAFAPG